MVAFLTGLYLGAGLFNLVAKISFQGRPNAKEILLDTLVWPADLYSAFNDH